jgi:hypothetical protein
MVDEKNELKEIRKKEFPEQPAAIRFAAVFFSYLFHPVFIPLYIVWFLVYVHPYLFAGFNEMDKAKVMIQAFVMFTFFPLITVLLLRALKFISNFQLATQKDRIIPLVACGIWYFWIWYVWRNLPEYPGEAIQFALAIWISVSLGLMANIIMKISLHAIAAGVALTFMLLLGLSQSLNSGLYISFAILVTGLICTSRLIVSDHSLKEVYTGLLLGAVSMLIAWWAG